MCPIVDGTPVDAATTNPQFIDAVVDSTGVGRVTLANTLVASGATVANVQAAINANTIATGADETDFNSAITYTVPANTLTNGDNHRESLEALAAKFAGLTGHTHTGVDGQGAAVLAASIASVPLSGYIHQGSNFTTAGSSSIVTSILVGKTPSTGSTVAGVVVDPPFNRVLLRYGLPPNIGSEVIDGNGNVVYGRLTYLAGVWTVSFYVDASGVETAYTFALATPLTWYYQELYNPLLNPPVYSEFAMVPSDNITQDVVTATTAIQGKVSLSSTAPAAIASSGSAGTSTTAIVANYNHTHEGVHSVGIDGDPTQALGDAKFVAGTLIGLAWSSGKIQISNTIAYNKETLTLSGTNITNQYVDLAYTVLTNSLHLSIDGVTQYEGDDYSLSTVAGKTRITFLNELATGGVSALVAGDKLRAHYAR